MIISSATGGWKTAQPDALRAFSWQRRLHLDATNSLLPGRHMSIELLKSSCSTRVKLVGYSMNTIQWIQYSMMAHWCTIIQDDSSPAFLSLECARDIAIGIHIKRHFEVTYTLTLHCKVHVDSHTAQLCGTTQPANRLRTRPAQLIKPEPPRL